MTADLSYLDYHTAHEVASLEITIASTGKSFSAETRDFQGNNCGELF